MQSGQRHGQAPPVHSRYPTGLSVPERVLLFCAAGASEWSVMWDDIGVIRDAAGLDRGIAALTEIEAELLATGVPI
jgi:hypothetical protein